ncbi:putative sodium-dependent multivitamin transporter, partial [Armadillidium vulgare]
IRKLVKVRYCGLLYVCWSIDNLIWHWSLLHVLLWETKSPEEFLMGNRSFKPFPVALSLLTSYVSSISILGFSGEAYANGMQFFTITLGVVMALNFSKYLLLPILYPLKLTTVNEDLSFNFHL